MSAAADPGAGRNWAVALVHGIGATEPVDMIRLVTGAIKEVRLNFELEDYTRVHEPAAASAPGLSADGQPCPQYVRHGAIGTAKVRFATAFWSDIAVFGEGLINLLGSLMLGGMGVRYFAYISTKAKQPLATALHWVLSAMILLLALIFFPLAFTSLLLSLNGLIAVYLFVDKQQYLQHIFIAVATMAFAALICGIGIKKLWPSRNDRRLAMPIFIMVLFFSFSGAIMLLAGHPGGLQGPVARAVQDLMFWYAELAGNNHLGARISLLDETSIYFGLFQVLQQLCALGVIVLTAVALFLLFFNMFAPTPRAHKRGLVFGCVCVISMWVIILVVMWPENFISNFAMNSYFNERAPLPADMTTYYFDLSRQEVANELAPATAAAFKKQFPLHWFDLAFFIFLVVTAAILVVLGLLRLLHRILYSRGDLNGFRLLQGARRPTRIFWPRLVLSWPYGVAVILFMLVVSMIGFLHATALDETVFEALFGIELKQELQHELPLRVDNVAIAVVAMIAGFLLIAHVIRAAVKLILDVVNHFVAPGRGFPVRRRIARRLKETIEFLLQDKDNPHLVVICHSQGTVITIDTLFGYTDHDGEWKKGLWDRDLSDRVSSLTVLTFGSPLTHIYQHYFCHVYPSFTELPRFVEISSDPKVKWLNCYRLDDYIGTYIENSIPNFPINVPMPFGGHTSYWKKDVFERLFKEDAMAKVLA